MTLKEFIKDNRVFLDEFIKKQYPNYKRLNDEERRQWILNDEDLYRWARRERVRI